MLSVGIVMLSAAKHLAATLPFERDPSLHSEPALNEVNGVTPMGITIASARAFGNFGEAFLLASFVPFSCPRRKPLSVPVPALQ